jgi:PIN domain nuclease of toxin-antitoxin system
MTARLLLDTHVLLRWLLDPKRLSRNQAKALERAVQRTEQIAVSAMSLLEIAILADEGKLELKGGTSEFFASLEGNPVFRLIPLTPSIALEAGALRVLRDPADRTIAATALVHGLQLVTSDQRIIESGLVAVVE